MADPMVVRVGRVYDPPRDGEGARVLVDRLWPRGLTKAGAQLDRWCRNVAPSSELRRWYAHDRARFDEFRRRYERELRASPAREALVELRNLAGKQELTLVTASRDVDYSHAAVLADVLAASSSTPPEPSIDAAGRDSGHGSAGDPACWSARVCPDCGGLAETDPPTRCPRCGTAIPEI